MLQIKDSVDQGFDLGREGTAVSSPWCLRPPPGRLKGWSKNHLEASSLDCPAVAVGSSLGLLTRTSTCGLSTWAAPLSFLIAWQLNSKGSILREQSRVRGFLQGTPKSHIASFGILSWLMEGRCHCALFGKYNLPQHTDSSSTCFYNISLTIPKSQ